MFSTNKSSWISDTLLITLMLGVFYAIWIGAYPLFTPDEGRYSEVAREMVVTGDYITPRINGIVFLDKPALYYWFQASAIKLFGLKEWALRLWPAIIGLFGCLMVYSAGRVLFSRRTGILSALVLATSPLYYGAAHYANLDLEVAVWISASLLFFILALRDPTKTKFFIAAYVFAGLAALTKGLIGIVFPVLIIGTWITLLNRWKLLAKMRLFTGALIFIAITLPWYFLVQKANPQFLHFFFVTQQYSRFLAHDDFNNKTVFWFYAPIVLIGFFPWSLFLIQATAKSIKTVWRNRQQQTAELFLLIWFFVIFTFFSLPKSKTIGYIMPIFPALALMIGHYLSEKSKGFYVGVIAFILSSFLIAVACAVAPQIKHLEIPYSVIPYLLYTSVAFLIGGIVTYGFLRKGSPTQLIACLTATIAAFLLILVASLHVINQNTIKPLAMQLKGQLKPSDEVVTYFKYYQDLPLYLERRVTIVADWTASDIPQYDNWLRELWYAMPYQDTTEWLINEDKFQQRWQSNKRLFVFMKESYYHDFAAKTKGYIHHMGQYNDIILVSNQ